MYTSDLPASSCCSVKEAQAQLSLFRDRLRTAAASGASGCAVSPILRRLDVSFTLCPAWDPPRAPVLHPTPLSNIQTLPSGPPSHVLPFLLSCLLCTHRHTTHWAELSFLSVRLPGGRFFLRGGVGWGSVCLDLATFGLKDRWLPSPQSCSQPGATDDLGVDDCRLYHCLLNRRRAGGGVTDEAGGRPAEQPSGGQAGCELGSTSPGTATAPEMTAGASESTEMTAPDGKAAASSADDAPARVRPALGARIAPPDAQQQPLLQAPLPPPPLPPLEAHFALHHECCGKAETSTPATTHTQQHPGLCFSDAPLGPVCPSCRHACPAPPLSSVTPCGTHCTTEEGQEQCFCHVHQGGRWALLRGSVSAPAGPLECRHC